MVLQDVRYALRQLLRNPGFTFVAVLTLALGIGANTIIFGIVNGLLLRPLAIVNPDRLVALFATDRPSGRTFGLSYPEYLDYRDHSGVFAGLAAQQGMPVSVGGGERAEVVWGEIVSENYFTVLGLAPALGRGFTERDAAGPGSDPLVVLSHRLWRRRFGGDRRIVGKVMSLNGEGPRPYMYLPMEQDYRAGMTLVVHTRGDPASLIPAVREVVGRLDPNLGTFGIITMADHLKNALNLARTSAILAGSFGAIALVLAVIGIYGVVSYSVARRTREVGIRLALGARRGDVLRLVLGNGLGLALAGTVVGLAAAIPAARLVGGMLYDVSPRDLSIFLATPVVLTAVVLLATYVPARRATRVDPVVSLRSE